MLLASVTVNERGATDRLLARVLERLHDDKVRTLGAVGSPTQNGGNEHCECALRLLPDGPVVRISQDLGTGSAACRMDAGALEDAVGITIARLAADGADLVVLNKFGLSEAEGRGFRALIAEALGRGLPVLLGLSDTHRAAFEQFSEGMAITLPPDEQAILDWCRATVRPDADATKDA